MGENHQNTSFAQKWMEKSEVEDERFFYPPHSARCWENLWISTDNFLMLLRNSIFHVRKLKLRRSTIKKNRDGREKFCQR